MNNSELKAILSDLIIDEELLDIIDTLADVVIENAVMTRECIDEDDYEAAYYRNHAAALTTIGKSLKTLAEWGDKNL